MRLVVVDTVFYVGIFIIITVFLLLLKLNFGTFRDIVPTVTQLATIYKTAPESLQAMAPTLTHTKTTLIIFVAKIIGLLIAAFVALVAFSSWTKSYIWSRMHHKKFTKRYLSRFFINNLTLWLLWAALFLIFYMTLKTLIFAVAVNLELALFIYLAFILHAVYDEKRNVWQNLRKTMHTAFFKAHRLLVPLIIGIVLVMLLMFTYVFIQTVSIVLATVLVIPTTMIFLTWFRRYAFRRIT